MCGCSCGSSGSSGPVIIQCGGATAPPAGGVTQPPPGNGGNNGGNNNGGGTIPPPVQRCSRLLVRVDSIHVSKADSFGFFGEPGGAAEWRLTVTVNDQSRTWSYDDVEDGRDYTLGYDFTIEIPNDSATVSIRASGFEDDLIGDDALPASQRTHGSSDNYGVGGTRQLHAANSDFDYTLNYTVTCLQNSSVSMISKKSMTAMVGTHVDRRSADRKIKAPKLDEADALTVFTRKLAARGVNLVRMDGDLAVFEGTRSVQQVAASVFTHAVAGRKTARGD